MANASNGEPSKKEARVDFQPGSGTDSDHVEVVVHNPHQRHKKKRKGASFLPKLFERSNGSLLNPRFDSDILESYLVTCYYPQIRRMFQNSVSYVGIASFCWALYFGLMQIDHSTEHWKYLVAGSVVMLLVSIAFLLFARSPKFAKHTKTASVILAIILVVAVQLPFLLEDPGFSPVATFFSVIEIVIMLYSFLPVSIYIAAGFGMLLSLSYEILTALRYEEMQGADYIFSKILLHIILHFLGIFIYIMCNTRMRSNFSKIGQSVIAQRDLMVEKELKEKMIHSLMPPDVAKSVMATHPSQEEEQDEDQAENARAPARPRNQNNTGEIIFRKFQMDEMKNVSILFADIVGFTKMSSNKTAERLVGLLNDLFGRFDKLCTASGCEKISTLGDCYYCVSGCPNACPEHAKNCVEMGLSMVIAIQAFDEDHNEEVNMRVGVHTGTVLCGIVGTKRFKFDVWSNDVTLANTMESSGEPGKVHISEETRKFLENDYEMLEGEEVPDMRGRKELIEHYDPAQSSFTIKHREEIRNIKTYFILGRKEGNSGIPGLERLAQERPEEIRQLRQNKGKTTEVQNENCKDGQTAVTLEETPATLDLFSQRMPDIMGDEDDEENKDDESNDDGKQADEQGRAPQNPTNSLHHPTALHVGKDPVLVATRHAFSQSPATTSVFSQPPLHASICQSCSSLALSPATSHHSDKAHNDNIDMKREGMPTQGVESSIGNGKQPPLSTTTIRKDGLTPESILLSKKEHEKEREEQDHFLISLIAKEDESNKAFFKPKISKILLTFEPEMENKLRHSFQDSHLFQEKMFSSPRYQMAVEAFIALLDFVILAICCHIVFDATRTVGLSIVTVVGLLLQALLFIDAFTNVACLKTKMAKCPGMLNFTLNWYVRNALGVIMPAVPAALIYVCLSCDFATSFDWNDRFFCFALGIALLQYLNYTMLRSLVKTIAAVIVGSILIILLFIKLCSYPELDDVAGRLSSVSTALNNSNSNSSSNLPYNTAINSSSQTFTSTTAPMAANFVADNMLFSGENILRFEIILATLLLLLLISIVNYELEMSYRLSFNASEKAQRDKENMQLNKDQADWLLHNIIPAHLADLFKTNRSYSMNHQDVGVIFATICNFNEFYDEMYAGGREYLRVLNELVSDYEVMLNETRFKDVEKIKTISASFMAAAGLNEERRAQNKHQHAHLFALMEFATELQQVVQRFNESIFNFSFVLNIGYNYGPVTAGVIGTTKLLYDIWGDTVNIASRMYSTGEPDRIQVPQSTADLLGEKFEFSYRDEIFVKGKGMMKTYLLEKKKDGATWE